MESQRSGKPWEVYRAAIVRRLTDQRFRELLRRNFAYFGTRNMIYFFPNTLICAKKWEIMAHELISLHLVVC